MNAAHHKTFLELHAQSTPLMLPNAWDAASTVLLQMDGAQAIATSSAALSWSLGYADGGALPLDQLLAAIARIMRVAKVPVTVDMEDGYSQSPSEVADLIVQVSRLGVVGMNLEDGAGSADLLAAKIGAIRKVLGSTPFFINARTDVFLKGLAKEFNGTNGAAAIALAAQRLRSYQAAGADGAFVPGMLTAVDAQALLAQLAPLQMPLNLMAHPSLAPTAELQAAGVRRISMGGSLFQTTYAYSRGPAKQFMAQSDAAGLFAHSLSYATMNAAFNA